MTIFVLLKAVLFCFLFLWLLFLVVVAFSQIYESLRSLVKSRSLILIDENEKYEEEVKTLHLETDRSEILFHCFFHGLVTLFLCWLTYRVLMESSETIRQALN